MAVLYGGNGATNFIGSGAADTIFGAGGNDTLNGRGGNDNIYGDSGNDSLIGGSGLDFMYGGEGDDTLNATEEGNDQLFGGFGNDLYLVTRSTDSVFEGPNQGIDAVRSLVGYTLDDNVENLVLTGVTDIDGRGNTLNNQITGNSANNNISGLDGNDTLTGGGGNDRFFFGQVLPAGAGVDKITDFVVGRDKIILEQKYSFGELETAGGSFTSPNLLLATDFAVINTPALAEQIAAATSSDEIVYNRVTGNLFYNANNNMAGFGTGGGLFATIVGSPDNLSNTSILVFEPPVT
ncbi:MULTISPECIES: calcium-binding protein [unclassified Microcoleus]|uniref:calcium-binding protein n=1 Tax=unclassified Microcoleus TaxID=2642155 RepID=UPI002FD52298